MPVTTTPEGYLLIPALIARTGIYDYYASEMRAMGVPIADAVPDEAIVRVYRDASAVFDQESLQSFEHKPLTVGHPDHLVGPDTVQDDMVGMSLAPVAPANDGKHTRVNTLLMAQDSIKRYKRGLKELSAGYTAHLRMQPGVTSDGVPYDAVQTKIIGNHIALVPKGRAGTARLLDVKKEAAMPGTEKTIDPVKYGAVKQQLADALASVTKLTADNDTLRGQVAALEASQLSDEAKQALIADGVKQALADAKTREAVVERARLFAPKVETVNADSTPRSLSDIMVDAIKAKNPNIVVDGQPEAYVRGVFDQLEAPRESAPAGSGVFPRQGVPHTDRSSQGELMSFAELRRAARGGR